MKKWGLGYLGVAAVLGLPVLLRFPALGWLFVPAVLTVSLNILFARRKLEHHWSWPRVTRSTFSASPFM